MAGASNSADDRCEQALTIMRGWDWENSYGDEQAIPLSTAISRLAMEGIWGAQHPMLRLLCRGDVIATGSYEWRSWDHGTFHSLADRYANIPQKRWQHLADYEEQQLASLNNQSDFPFEVDLDHLKLEGQPVSEWEFQDSRFSTAMISPLEGNRVSWEEWYSAFEIYITLAPSRSEPAEQTLSATTIPPKGGRPLAKWWPDFAEELAVYIHENGLPDGQGHDGQSDVIDAIFRKLSERGKPEPGRATVQPVVNAVLSRIRSAEN